MALIFTVDGSNYLWRGHHAVPTLSAPNGQLTGAIKGFMEILLADFRAIRPTHAAIVFDIGGRTWRHEAYAGYKANRSRKKKTPEEIEVMDAVNVQRRILRRLLKAMGIRIIAKKGIEGDDILGGIAMQHGGQHKVLIATKDKDLYQHVSDKVHIWPPTRKPIGPKGTVEQFGVRPDQIVDYLMLLGDTVDGIPGVDKCGPKTAAKWLAEHGTLCAIIKARPFKPDSVIGKNFDKARPLFKLTRQLITARSEIPPKMSLDKLKLGEPDMEEIRRICAKYALRSTYSTILRYFEQGPAPARPKGLF